MKDFRNDEEILYSIIIPMYNAEKYIADTIQSIVDQSVHSLEIIVVDDGSRDNSALIVEQLSRKYVGIVLIRSENNGAPYARNLGLEKSKGKYVIFFDADDLMQPSYMEEVTSQLCFDPDIIIGKYQEISEQGMVLDDSFDNKIDEGIYFSKNVNHLSTLMGINAQPDAKIFRKEFLIHHGIFFDDVSIGQDLNLYYKCLAVDCKICIINKGLVLYRILYNSIDHKATKKVLGIIDSFELVKKFAEEHNAADFYFDYLCTYQVINYAYQLSKFIYIEDYQERRNVFKDLSRRIACIDYKVLNKHACKLYKRNRWFRRCSFIFTNSVCIKILKIVKDKKAKKTRGKNGSHL